MRVAYPVRADRALGLGATPTLRLQRALRRARAASTPSSSVLVWSHWMWFLVPHGTSPTCSCATRSASRAGAARMYATFDLGLDRLLGRADRAAVVRRAAGPHGRRPHARAAADDGRVRRAVLEVRLGAPVRFPRRQPAGRHALAALRDIRDGRPPARRRSGRVAGRAGLDLRRDARLRARLPGRALRRRPAAGLALTEARAARRRRGVAPALRGASRARSSRLEALAAGG